MADDENVIFDGKEDIENWTKVEGPENTGGNRDYNDYDFEFVDVETIDEGDMWVGEYTGNRQFENAQSPSHFIDNDDEELTYVFPNHVQIRTQVADTELEEHQSRSKNPVEIGDTIAIIYRGEEDVEGRPMPMHVWEMRVKPEDE